MVQVHSRRRLWGGPALSICILFSSCSPFMVKNYSDGYDSHEVKILVLKTKNTFTISSRGTIRLYQNNQLISNNQPFQLSYTYNPGTIKSTIMAEPGNEPILLNGQPYRGSFIVQRLNDFALIINVLKIDEYLLSVVPGEIPANWEEEALKAQAVAARTFTYYHFVASRNRVALYDLDATSASQVYRGIVDEKPRTTEAVKKTTGQVMVYEEKPILSYFHSTCGGKTIDDRYVWNKSHLPYLQGVRCGFCNDSTKYSWESKILLDEIQANLSKKYPSLRSIRNISFKKKDDRIVEVSIQHGRGTIRMSGNNFRLLFPPDKIKSLYFTSKKIKDGLILTGHGWGHGVGLCQWGARGMAVRGYSYHDILNHYYIGVRITSVRNVYMASKIKYIYNYQ